MKYILDTNVLVVSISRKSPHYWIWEYLQKGNYQIAVTTDILTEYEEVLNHFYGQEVSKNVLATLDHLPNVQYITKFYRWELIKIDLDDNKFVDACIAFQAEGIVTEDKHFNTLKKVEFPPVQVLSIDQFQKKLNP